MPLWKPSFSSTSTIFASIENLELKALLFQTGYLTIKHIDRQRGWFTLDYPNREVEEAMSNYLIASLLHRQAIDSRAPIFDIGDAFRENHPERVVEIIHSLLKDVPSLLLDGKDEHFYHALVHLHFRYLGLFMDSEVHTSDGRMDAVVQTDERVFILEFKIDQPAQKAIDQILEKGYADKFRAGRKLLTGMGISFDSGRKGVGEHLIIPL